MAQYFSIFLVAMTALSGIVWLINVMVLRPKHNAQAQASAKADVIETPQSNIIVEEIGSFFPWLSAILILRSFIFEPFQIPTGSMIPTLLVGDFIWVEKYAYGLRDPVTRTKFLDVGSPQRGDIAVFKYPVDPTVDYIKRVIGVPGDVIRYHNNPTINAQRGIDYNKRLWIKTPCSTEQTTDCGQFKEIVHQEVNRGEFFRNNDQRYPMIRATEQLHDVKHDILITPASNPDMSPYFNDTMGEFVVPEGHYFVMGDNRDNSADSRFWGFVPEDNLVGKAVAIWISFEFSEDPNDILPSWLPRGIRFDRIGGIQ
tara:strand:+ start:5880 stop:6818 length:939 start_codon:yes stop_codon:yes gene_type:complete